MTEEKRRPVTVGEVVRSFLREKGLAARVAQTRVVDEWPELVGDRIASVAQAISVSADGTLLVTVTTHAWMSELSLLEPELLRVLNAGKAGPKIRRIRLVLRR